jgi:hypothetical protein
VASPYHTAVSQGIRTPPNINAVVPVFMLKPVEMTASTREGVTAIAVCMAYEPEEKPS